MRSKWISHKDRQIFWQDFSHHMTDAEAVKEELQSVQNVVTRQPRASLLVLADFRNTQVGKDLMDSLVASSSITKPYIKKTAVLGVVGTKRILAETLVRLTGQILTTFDDIETAKEWLIQD